MAWARKHAWMAGIAEKISAAPAGAWTLLSRNRGLTPPGYSRAGPLGQFPRSPTENSEEPKNYYQPPDAALGGQRPHPARLAAAIPGYFNWRALDHGWKGREWQSRQKYHSPIIPSFVASNMKKYDDRCKILIRKLESGVFSFRLRADSQAVRSTGLCACLAPFFGGPKARNRLAQGRARNERRPGSKPRRGQAPTG